MKHKFNIELEVSIDRDILNEVVEEAFKWAEDGGYKTGSNYWILMFTDSLETSLNDEINFKVENKR